MAKLLSNLMVVVGAETGNFDKAMKGIERSLKRTSRDLENLGRSMSLAVTAPLLAAGAASVKFGMDAVETENLFSVSMGNMADAGRKFADDLSNSLGINRYETLQYTGTLNQMLRSMGFAQDGAYGMSTALTKLVYDFASFYNVKPEEAFIKIQAGLTGEMEQLKRHGILVDEATVKTYAYKEGIAKQGEELSQGQKVLARYAAIMAQTANAQGDLARTIDSPTNQLRVLKSTTEELATTIGQRLLPMVSKGITFLNDKAKALKNLNPEVQDNIILLAGLAAATPIVILGLARLTQAVQILAGTGALGALLSLAGRVVFAFQAMAGGAATFGQALAFISGPIGWVTTGLAVLAAGYLYYNKAQSDARAEEEQHQKTIIGLADRYKDLEEQLANNKKGTVEYQMAADEMQRLREEMKKTAPEMLQMFDEEGNRVEVLTGKLYDAAAAYRALYRESRLKELRDLQNQRLALEKQAEEAEKKGDRGKPSNWDIVKAGAKMLFGFKKSGSNLVADEYKDWKAEAEKFKTEAKKIKDEEDRINRDLQEIVHGVRPGETTSPKPQVPKTAPGGDYKKEIDPMKEYNEEMRRLNDLSREAKANHEANMLALQGESKEQQRNTELMRYNQEELRLKDLRIGRIIAQLGTLTEAERLSTTVGAELRAALATENFERMQLNKTIETQRGLLGALTADLDANTKSIAEWIKSVTNLSAKESVRLAQRASVGENVATIIGMSGRPMTAAEQAAWNANIDAGRADQNNPTPAAAPASQTTNNVTINATSNDPGAIARATTRALETAALVGAR